MKKFLLTIAAAFVGVVSACAADVVFDFATETYGLTRQTDNSGPFIDNGTALTVNGDVTVTLNKTVGKNGWRLWSDGLRAYKSSGAAMTLNAGTHKITGIKFEMKKDGIITGYKVGEGAEVAVSATPFSVSCDASEVALAFTVSSNGAITKMTVTLDGEGGGDNPPTPPTPPAVDTEGQGTEASPYTVADVIKLNSPKTTSWVVGYIVGSSNGGATLELTAADAAQAASNVLIAATPDETDLTKMVPVQLVSGSDVRKAVNLVDNPGNRGKQLSIQGILENYFGTPGVKSPSAYKLDGEGGGDNPPTPPAVDTEGQGTEASPYTVADVIKLNSPKTTNWVVGYIVGSSNGGATLELTAADAAQAASNVLIAATPDETDLTKMVPVQLVSGSDVRKAVNLVDNPGNRGKQLSIQGILENYFGTPGVKSPSAYKLDGEGGGDTPTPGAPTEGPGSENEPLSIADAVAKNNDGTINWVTGVIVGVYDYVDGEGNVFDGEAPFTTATNIVIATSAAETDYFAVQLPSGSKLRDDLALTVRPNLMGKEVSVCGKLLKYCGVSGMKETSAYSIVGGLPSIPVEGSFPTLTDFVEDQPSSFATITGDVTVFYQSPDRKYTFITDGTSSLEVYCGAGLPNTYENGDVLSGIAGKHTVYRKMPQMEPLVESFGTPTAGTPVEPAVTALDKVGLAQYVVVENVNITDVVEKTEKTPASATVTSNGATRVLFDRFGIGNINAAEGVTIVGIGAIFDETLQIFPVSIDYDNSGISEISAEKAASNVVYDLQGRKVFNPRRGLYIVNGKKVIL